MGVSYGNFTGNVTDQGVGWVGRGAVIECSADGGLDRDGVQAERAGDISQHWRAGIPVERRFPDLQLLKLPGRGIREGRLRIRVRPRTNTLRRRPQPKRRVARIRKWR